MIHIILLYGIKQPNNIVDHRYVNLFFFYGSVGAAHFY